MFISPFTLIRQCLQIIIHQFRILVKINKRRGIILLRKRNGLQNQREKEVSAPRRKRQTQNYDNCLWLWRLKQQIFRRLYLLIFVIFFLTYKRIQSRVVLVYIFCCLPSVRSHFLCNLLQQCYQNWCLDVLIVDPAKSVISTSAGEKTYLGKFGQPI